MRGVGSRGGVDDPAGRRPDPIDLAHAGSLVLGALDIAPALRRVARGDGREEIVEPRVMQVLVVLVRADGGIVSRDDLLAACWHGVVVGEDAINRIIGRVRRLLEGIGEAEHRLETITKVGYRIVPTAAAVAPEPPPPAPAAALSAKPSIAVLRFANLSGDPAEDYFADGMVEEIVTALSRLRSILVVAGGSGLTSSSVLGGERDPSRPGVRYALEGSVRRAAGRVRIAVRLIDIAGQAQIWAERFEDALDDVFALQDRIALAVAGVIEPAVQRAELLRTAARPTEHLGSHDLYLRALALYRAARPEATLRALELLTRATELDPGYGLALALGAICHRDLAVNDWCDDPAAHERLAVDMAERALRAAGDDAEVLAFAGAVLGAFTTDHAAVIALFDRAVALNPGSSTAWLSSGMMRLRAGDPDSAAEHLETSMRLDPLSSLRGRQLLGLGAARFEQGRHREAASLLKESVRLLPIATGRLLLVACLGHLGEIEEARAALDRWASLGEEELQAHVPKLISPRQIELCRQGLALVLGHTLVP
jgi:TolB-like protein/Tfp pilus assembly protein PilF